MAANKHNLPALREHLFDCMSDIKSKHMSIDEAKAACMIAQTIINTVRIELEFAKLVGKKESSFFEAGQISDAEVVT